MIVKTIPPFVFGAVTFVAMVSIVIDPREALPDAAGFLLIMLPMTTFVIWWATRLKWVSVDDQNLYVAGWAKEILHSFDAN